MNAPTPTGPPVPPLDDDMAEQARPGHGIPSQDPDPAAQVALSPQEAEREAKSVMMGGGLVGGAAVGASIGMAVAGPVGVLIGGTLGAAAGALGGAGAGSMAAPDVSGPGGAAVVGPVQLYVEDTGGAGRPVLLIHGWPMSAQSWSAQTAVLQAAGYRVVAYDRRGFGRSEKPATGYDYDMLADDLQQVIQQCELRDVTLVGFSMGGGEVARYIARHGESRVHSVVFAAAVPPFLLQGADNPDGPLTASKAQQMREALEADRSAFFEQFTTDFFSADGVPQVDDAQRQQALALCEASSPQAALACMDAFASTDFRQDLQKLTRPTLVIHGEADAIVPLAGSGLRTHRAVAHSQLVRVAGAPHGLNVSHAKAFNDALLAFLAAGELQPTSGAASERQPAF